jgi:hypothetical protein
MRIFISIFTYIYCVSVSIAISIPHVFDISLLTFCRIWRLLWHKTQPLNILKSTSRYELGDSELEGGRGLLIYCVNTLRLLIGNFCNRECKHGSSDVMVYFLSPLKYHSGTVTSHHMQDYFSASGELFVVCTACHDRWLAVKYIVTVGRSSRSFVVWNCI